MLKKIKVYPEIIDNNHLGEIKVMMEATVGVLVIPRRERIAQLVLLRSFHSANPLNKQVRGGKELDSDKSPGTFWDILGR